MKSVSIAIRFQFYRLTCFYGDFNMTMGPLHWELLQRASIFGVEKEIEVTRIESCGTCGGSGAKPGPSASKRTTCGGQGQVVSSARTPLGVFQQVITCSYCCHISYNDSDMHQIRNGYDYNSIPTKLSKWRLTEHHMRSKEDMEFRYLLVGKRCMVTLLSHLCIQAVVFSVWVAYKESSWINAFLWILFILSFGSIACIHSARVVLPFTRTTCFPYTIQQKLEDLRAPKNKLRLKTLVPKLTVLELLSRLYLK